MNQNQLQEYREKIAQLGSRPGLDTMIELLRRLGNPQNELKAIHVAGTNGKGSTCCMLESVLHAAGYKTGKYSSPAVFDEREKYKVNQKMVSQKVYLELFERIIEVSDAMEEEGLLHPTIFEMETALAFLLFCKKKCDYVIIETGMGGELDATNVMENKLASVFTSISYDHMNFLGDTLEEIAKQKSGIIKNTRYVIAGVQKPEVFQVLKDKAMSLACKFSYVDEEKIGKVKSKLNNQRFAYKNWKDIEIQLNGTYQIKNTALVLETIMALRELGVVIPDEKVYQGIKEAYLEGRCSVIENKPLFIMDGAHNEGAAKELAETIRECFTNKRIIYIIGVLKDKEVESIIRNTCEYAEEIITVSTPDPVRGMHAYDLAKEVYKFHSHVTAADSIEEAVEMAYLFAEKQDVIIAFGSLSYLNRLKEAVLNRKMNRSDSHGRSK